MITSRGFEKPKEMVYFQVPWKHFSIEELQQKNTSCFSDHNAELGL